MTNGKWQLSERPSLPPPLFLFFFKRWREISLLSQPIITGWNISRENNVKFRLKEQSIQDAGKKREETRLTYENNSS